MKNTMQQFRAVRCPEGVTSHYAVVVVDGKGIPHLPLGMVQMNLTVLNRLNNAKRLAEPIQI